ncbi:hypothetical protein G0U15_001121 [Staphylococcus pseudintermedius]|nr:hypothetical protein [Staphylococcus pseudintermedius]MDK3983746.1 hypothetical protein [Staphylococcus pseudintermedius]HAR5802694.1 hypothetical protein [Staphylococcus pseudintermedius]
MTKSEALKVVNHINKLICKSNKNSCLTFSIINGKPEILFVYIIEFGRAKNLKISDWFNKELVEEAVEKIEKILNEEALLDE